MTKEDHGINFFPFLNDFKTYGLSYFRKDLIAALSVALLALPQAMAYAFVAELPPSAGIFAAIFGTIFTAAFGASPLLISGPSNTVAILIQSSTSDILYTFYSGVSGFEKEIVTLQIVLQISLIIGIFQILGGLLNLGRLTQFPSRSAILGYLLAASFTIAISQLFYFFGIPDMGGNFPLYYQTWYLISHVYLLHLPTTLMGLGCLLLLVFLPKLSEKIPSAIIVFFIAGLVVVLFHLAPKEKLGSFDVKKDQKIEKVTLLEDIGPVYAQHPKIAFPSFDIKILGKIIPLAFAISLFSALEATAIGRTFATSKDPNYSDNQEVYGLGISNLLSSFVGAMPSSGSFSRTVLNANSGGVTRFAAIFSGLWLFLIVATLGFFVTKIPLTALSALLLLTAYSMINFRDLFLCLRATKGDAFVVIVTFISSMLFTLDVALYIGIVTSIVLYLKKATSPNLVEYTFNKIGKLRPMDPADPRADPRICIMHIEGELFFGAADYIQTRLKNLAEDEHIKVFILQIINARYIDASICLILKRFCIYLKDRQGKLLISGVSSEVKEILQDAGLVEVLGEKNMFEANERLPGEPTRLAYAYAKTIL